MFTGIVERTVTVTKAVREQGVLRVTLSKPGGWKLYKGASIAVDGICSTIVSSRASSFVVEYMSETLSKTTAGFFRKGTAVNLERPLTYGKSLDGHFVLGHVDARLTVRAVESARGSRILTIAIPAALRRFVVPRGSLTVNGVALTVARVRAGNAFVALVPYTLKHTTLAALKKGDAVNIEADLLARYLFSSDGVRVSRNAKKKERAGPRRPRRI